MTDLFNGQDPSTFMRPRQVPKFIVSASGDEFFLPEQGQVYASEIPAGTYLYRSIPNSGHNIALDPLFEFAFLLSENPFGW